MKLLRFIRNVWNGAWDALFDADLKVALKSMCIYVICFGVFIGGTYGLGWLGKLMGVSGIMAPDKREDLFSIGVMMLSVLLTIFFLGVAIFVMWIKVKEIWDKS